MANAAAQIYRLMQRLDSRRGGYPRSKFTLDVEMRVEVARMWTEGYTSYTEYHDVRRPWWRARLEVPCRGGWVYELMGFGTTLVEGPDLLAVLTELEERTRPSLEYLDERVWEHEDFKKACDLGATLTEGAFLMEVGACA